MKEGTPISNHLNDFHTIVSQLTAQDVQFLDSVKAMFLLINLLEKWDTFKTALSNSVSTKCLTTANVEGTLLTKEVNRKNNDKGKSNSALFVKGQSINREKKGKRWQSHSKSRDPKAKSDIECYYCGKKGHMKRDYTKWKEEKGKEKDSELEEKKKSSMKIQEINVMENSSLDSDDSKEI